MKRTELEETKNVLRYIEKKCQHLKLRKFLWGQVSQLEAYKYLKLFYNEEFDPGSGWTLAAGLTHASRGAADHFGGAGDRRTGEYRVCNLPLTEE